MSPLALKGAGEGGERGRRENFACDAWDEGTILVLVVMTQGLTRHDQRSKYAVCKYKQEPNGMLAKLALHAIGNSF